MLPAVVLVALATMAPSHDDDTSLGIAYVCLAAGIFLLTYVPYFAMRLVMKSPNANAPVTLTASRQGLGYIAAHSSASFDWIMIKMIVETKSAILISLNPTGFYVVPTRGLNVAEVNAFRAVLRAHAPGGARLPQD